MAVNKMFFSIFLILGILNFALAQPSKNDTIRLGAITENNKVFPMILLPEISVTGKAVNQEEVKRLLKLRNDVFITYPYALTAAVILKNVNTDIEKMDSRKERKLYIKSIDKKLDIAFKEPLKNLSVDQGHVLIKLIDRQTGRNCYSIIREFKNGFAALMWQSVGVFFNNNLYKRYEPDGDDKEIENYVKEIESTNLYYYEIYQQQLLLSKVKN